MDSGQRSSEEMHGVNVDKTSLLPCRCSSTAVGRVRLPDVWPLDLSLTDGILIPLPLSNPRWAWLRIASSGGRPSRWYTVVSCTLRFTARQPISCRRDPIKTNAVARSAETSPKTGGTPFSRRNSRGDTAMIDPETIEAIRLPEDQTGAGETIDTEPRPVGEVTTMIGMAGEMAIGTVETLITRVLNVSMTVRDDTTQMPHLDVMVTLVIHVGMTIAEEVPSPRTGRKASAFRSLFGRRGLAG